MRKSWAYAVAAVTLAANAAASGDITVTIVPAGFGSVTQLELINGKWRVTLRVDQIGFGSFFVKGTSADPIEWVYVDSLGPNPGKWAELWIDGASLPFDIPSVDQVRPIGLSLAGQSDVILRRLFANGDVGLHAIEAHRINEVRTQGDIVGPIRSLQGGAVVPGIDMVRAEGNIFANIESAGDDSLIDTVSAGGLIGTSQIPVTVAVCGAVGRVEGATLFAHVTALNGLGCTGFVRKVATLSGN